MSIFDQAFYKTNKYKLSVFLSLDNAMEEFLKSAKARNSLDFDEIQAGLKVFVM